MMTSPRYLIHALAALAVAFGTGCGSDAPSAPPTPTQPTAPPLAGLTVSATSTAALIPGETVQLSAIGTNAQGSVVSNPATTWTTSAASVAVVSATGVVTGVAPGSATITATAGGRSASTEVTIAAGGVVAPSGGIVASSNGAVSLTIPAGAVPSQLRITIEPIADPAANEHTVAGSVHDFGPDGTQFAAPVTMELKYDASALVNGADPSSLRLAKLVDGQWQVLTEGAAVDPVRGVVSASVRSFSTYGIVRDPCVVGAFGTGVSGQISTTDCLYTTAGRRSDYYTLQAPAGQVLTVSSSGALEGLFGLKQATDDPSAGTVWISGSIGGTVRLVSNGSPLQLFVSGSDSTKFGSYAFTSTVSAPAHSCSTATYLMPGASFGGAVTSDNSCKPTVQFSPIPQAMGKPLLAHYYGAKLEAGKSYTIRLGGLTPDFQPGLSVFASGAVVAQQLPSGTTVTSRTVTITPQATRYFTIEISSGYFIDGNYTTWVTPNGGYTLSVTP